MTLTEFEVRVVKRTMADEQFFADVQERLRSKLVEELAERRFRALLELERAGEFVADEQLPLLREAA